MMKRRTIFLYMQGNASEVNECDQNKHAMVLKEFDELSKHAMVKINLEGIKCFWLVLTNLD